MMSKHCRCASLQIALVGGVAVIAARSERSSATAKPTATPRASASKATGIVTTSETTTATRATATRRTISGT